jgi:hypothetical protein
VRIGAAALPQTLNTLLTINDDPEVASDTAKKEISASRA